jgi:hypothetical protein
MRYLHVLISAEPRGQGLKILRHLVGKRLAFGRRVLGGPVAVPAEGDLIDDRHRFR